MLSRAIAPHSLIEGERLFPIPSVQKRIMSFGKHGYLIAEEKILRKFHHVLLRGLKKNITKRIFSGIECTMDEIASLSGGIRKDEFVIGMGGGKALDTAKAVAQRKNVPCITIPTSAATCAATSALSAIYHKNGAASHYIVYDTCPDLVIIDHTLIVTSSKEMFAAGMADALAKYYESFAFTQGIAPTMYEKIALETARTIYDTIFSKGKKALDDMKKGTASKEYKDIVRTNIVLAGLVGGMGGEGCRACASHAVNNGLTHIPEMRHFLHGQVVGFGNLVQLALQKKYSEIKKLQRLYHTLDLPVSFDYFNITFSKPLFEKVITAISSPKDTLHNMPFRVTKHDVQKAFQLFMH